MGFDPCNRSLKIRKSIEIRNSRWTTTFPSELPLSVVHLGMWGFILSLSCTLGSLRYASWASLLSRTLASPCLGREPKARVATLWFKNLMLFLLYYNLNCLYYSMTSQSGDPFVLVLFKCFHNIFTRCPRFSVLFV
jgi:hypothetical protein